MADKKKSARRLFPRRSIQILLALIVLLIGVRIALPFIVLHYVNKELASLEGYWGHARDVDISLLRGAYRIEGIRIVKTGGRVPVPFFRSPSIDISIDWHALLEGPAIVAEINVLQPELNFVNSRRPARDQTGAGPDWQQTVRDLVPIKINRVHIHDGEIHFRDFEREPAVDIYVQNIYFDIYNLTNSKDLSGTYVAHGNGTARAMHSGRVRMRMRVNPYARKPTFHLWLSMRHLNLPELNSFLDGYAGVDAEDGTFALYTEINAHNGRFRGYVKPIIEDAQIFTLGRESEGFLGQAWEAIVQFALEVFENQPSDPDRFATRIPIRGRIENPEADVWTTIGGILKNAFIRALHHGLERALPT